ncbi:MAG: DUF47 family protein [Candidatus Dormiibacterota bacterium]
MRHWFLPHSPDVLATLREQSRLTVDGLDAFLEWSSGDGDRAPAVREAEHAADAVRRQLQQELRVAFSVPFDAEDIYTLSERLDVVLNGAKDAVREAEVMTMRPDAHLAAMAASILDGVRHLASAFEMLTHDQDRATAEADAAINVSRAVEKRYRVAMSEALNIADIRELFGRRELYRRYARMGDQVVRVAERVWYTVVKHS